MNTYNKLNHFLIAKVPPHWKLNQGFVAQKNCPFPPESIEVTNTKIIRTFLRDQILCPLNGGGPKERFHYSIYFKYNLNLLNRNA